jgi:hypothetical protein
VTTPFVVGQLPRGFQRNPKIVLGVSRNEFSGANWQAQDLSIRRSRKFDLIFVEKCRELDVRQ